MELIKTKQELREACLNILRAVWLEIDWNNVSSSRRIKIYDEFLSKMVASYNVNTIAKFVENICRKWGIRDIRHEKILEVERNFSDKEILNTLRIEPRMLILLLREENDTQRNLNKAEEKK